MAQLMQERRRIADVKFVHNDKQLNQDETDLIEDRNAMTAIKWSAKVLEWNGVLTDEDKENMPGKIQSIIGQKSKVDDMVEKLNSD